MGRTRLQLEVRDTEGTFQSWLEGQEFVASVDQVTRDGDVSEATVALSQDQRENLAAAIIGAGYGLRRLEAAHDALETIFLGLTRSGDA